jgi:dTDP-4-dehydrorhamnose reductase
MTILITGANGQLGQELIQVLSPHSSVVGVARDRLDLSQPDTIRQTIAAVQPTAIVNCGAYTAVDKAESEPELAEKVNGVAPGVIAEEAQKLGAMYIHISTDYVFDGTQSHPYLETDPTNPIGAYGRSKRAGERAIEQVTPQHIILRTAWVYGAGKTGNFVKTMLRLGAEREELRVVADQIGSPTWTGDMAGAIGKILTEHRDLTGTFHLTNSGAASWYDFAIAIFEEARLLGFPLKLQRVVPITTADYPTPAQRPAYSVLAHQKLAAVLGAPQPHWRQGLRLMLGQLKTSI